MNNSNNKFLILCVISASIFINGCYCQISTGSVGIERRYGEISKQALPPGLYFWYPFRQIDQLDVKILSSQIHADSSTHDMQNVNINATISHMVTAEQATKLVSEVGHDYVEKLILPLTQESIKAVCAKYTAQNMINQRSEMSRAAFENLQTKLTKYGIVLAELSFVNLVFAPAYVKAIEDKQIAEQEVLKAKQTLERVKIENEQRLSQATTQAEVNELMAKSLNNPVVLRKMEIDKWDGKFPATLVINKEDAAKFSLLLNNSTPNKPAGN